MVSYAAMTLVILLVALLVLVVRTMVKLALFELLDRDHIPSGKRVRSS